MMAGIGGKDATGQGGNRCQARGGHGESRHE